MTVENVGPYNSICAEPNHLLSDTDMKDTSEPRRRLDVDVHQRVLLRAEAWKPLAVSSQSPTTCKQQFVGHSDRVTICSTAWKATPFSWSS